MDGSSRSTQSGGPRTLSELACNICLRRMPNSPVLTYCGHVFCWSCLYRSWAQQGPGVQAGPGTKSCPVCGTALREGFNIVPIYGYDNVAAPRSGTERPTSTSTTMAAAAAAAAPDTATTSHPTAAAAAPVSNTPIPPRPTAASFLTATPPRPHSVAARAAAAAATNTAIPPRPAASASALSSDTDIPPRPNPPARITQTHTQTQTDAARSLRNLSSTSPRNGFVGGLFGFGRGDRLRRSLSLARNINLGVASRSIRRRRNLRLNPRGMDGNGGNRFESYRARLNRVLNEILVDIGATLEDMAFDDRVGNEKLDDIEATLEDIDALFEAREEREDDLT